MSGKPFAVVVMLAFVVASGPVQAEDTTSSFRGGE